MKFNPNKIAIYGVSIIAGAAFLLSFDALRHMAINFGFSPWLAWLFPISVDLAILVYSVASIIRRMKGLPAKMEMYFVAIVTVLSIVLNALHDCQAAALKITVHALPPILLCMAVETVTRIITTNHEVRKAGAVKRKALKTVKSK